MKTKFIAMGVIAFSMLGLASCLNQGTKADYSTTRQVSKFDDDVKTAFKLFYDSDETNAEKLDKDSKSGSYYDLYTAKDATASLFKYEYDLTSYFSTEDGARNKNITVNTLSFAIQGQEALYDEEKSAILTQAYDTEKGVAKKLTVDFTVTTSKDYSRTFGTQDAYKAFEANETLSLSIVYMPVYVIHYVSNQPVLRNYVFLPIYSTFVTASGKEVTTGGALVDSKVSTVASLDLKHFFDESGKTLRAAKPEETPAEPENPTEEGNTNNGLCEGAIVGIVLGSVFGALILIYFVLGFTLYRSGKLNSGFFKAIYKWIKRPTSVKKK
jgi:hypothetical protein